MKTYKSINPCKSCNSYFSVNRKDQIENIYCSKECFYKNHIVEKIKRFCRNCNNEFLTTQKTIDANGGIYCCMKCYREYKSKHGLTDIQKQTVSIATKKAMIDPEIRQHFLDSYTPERRRKLSEATKKQMEERYKTEEDRLMWSKKLSLIRKNSWNSLSPEEKEKRSNILLEKGLKKHLSLLKTDKNYKDSFKKNFEGSNNPFYGKQHSIETINKIKEKMSYTMAKLVSEGKFDPRGHFQQGYYTSKLTNETFYYASSYELKRMQQLDEMNVKWTKNHKIKIPYTDYDGNLHHYVPDFLINDVIVEEVKPASLLNSIYYKVPLKTVAGIEYCKNNNLTYRIITEKELGINI